MYTKLLLFPSFKNLRTTKTNNLFFSKFSIVYPIDGSKIFVVVYCFCFVAIIMMMIVALMLICLGFLVYIYTHQ